MAKRKTKKKNQRKKKDKNSSLRIGRRGEYTVIGKLMEEGFNPYVPVIDGQGVDCVLKNGEQYVDVQIKASDKPPDGNILFDIKNFVPRKNLYFVFCAIVEKTYWVVPSKAVKRHSKIISDKSIRLTTGPRSSTTRYKFEEYCFAFNRIRKALKLG